MFYKRVLRLINNFVCLGNSKTKHPSCLSQILISLRKFKFPKICINIFTSLYKGCPSKEVPFIHLICYLTQFLGMQSSKFLYSPLNIPQIVGDCYKNVKDWLLKCWDKWKQNVQNTFLLGHCLPSAVPVYQLQYDHLIWSAVAPAGSLL